MLMHELGLRYDDGFRLKCLCSWAAYVAGPLWCSCMSWGCSMTPGCLCCCNTTQSTHFKAGVRLCRWAAYVAGPLVVLMHELGLRYDDGLSLLLSSAVPEGKGVSSSAAVEVAVTQAICAAYNVQLDGRHLALLCQKVLICWLHTTCQLNGGHLALLCSPDMLTWLLAACLLLACLLLAGWLAGWLLYSSLLAGGLINE